METGKHTQILKHIEFTVDAYLDSGIEYLVEVCNPTSTKAVLMEAMNKHLLNK
jgi:hypothetical protein